MIQAAYYIFSSLPFARHQPWHALSIWSTERGDPDPVRLFYDIIRATCIATVVPGPPDCDTVTSGKLKGTLTLEVKSSGVKTQRIR